MTVYLAVAMISAVFDIGRARDAAGEEIIPVNECTPGIVRSVFYYLALLHLLHMIMMSFFLVRACRFSIISNRGTCARLRLYVRCRRSIHLKAETQRC